MEVLTPKTLIQVLQRSSLEEREAVRSALGIDDNYARKSDITEILLELKAQREEWSQKFDLVYEELKAQREELKAQREEWSKELKAQREEWSKELKAQREELKKQREEWSQKFDKTHEEIMRMNKSITKLGKQYERLEKKTDNQYEFLQSISGINLELMSLSWFKSLFRAKNHKIDAIEWRKMFYDKSERLGTTEVEVDIFNENPLMVAEITAIINDITKITKFIKKIELITEIYEKKPIAYLVTNKIEDKIQKDAKSLIKQEGIELITV